MKKVVCLLLLVGIIFPLPAFALSLHKVHLDWDYENQPVEGESLAGFRLYKEGELVCQINDPAVRSADCHVQSEEGTFHFTLTAFYSGGTETPHSSPYTFTLSSATLAVDSHELLSTHSIMSDPVVDPAGGGADVSQTIFAADFSGLDESDMPLLPALLYPHVEVNPDWETEISLVNTNPDLNLVGVLRAYSDDGRPLAAELPVNLSPHARYELRVGESFANPQEIGYLVLAANHQQVVGYAKFFIGGRCRVAVPAVSEINAGDFSLPLTISAQDWWTKLCLLNTTDMDKILTIRFDNGDVRQIFLSSGEHKAVTIAGLFDDETPSAAINGAVVENGAGVVGYELLSGGNNIFTCAMLLSDRRSEDLYYPLHAGNSDGWTCLFAYNPSTQPTILTITSYTEEGASLSLQDVVLDGHGQFLALAGDLHLQPDAAWVRIHSSIAITGFDIFGAAEGMGSTSAVAAGRQSGVFAKCEHGDDLSGFSLVNDSAKQAQVTVSAYDDMGTLVSSHDFLISSFSKLAGQAEDFFPEDSGSVAYVTYDSSVALTGCQYNASVDGRMMDVLPAL